jgi:2-oxoglutarate/2-oxoacid ferredoxin oxidoreductase subunit beta
LIMQAPEPIRLTKKDFTPDQSPRWCPGCGDYAVLNTVQKVLPELGIPRERFVWVSGIGCSSRFPYYMNTYGLHTIHGRALPIATGIRVANPTLSVWVATGDGDALSIGGNHAIHCLRRNVDVKVLVFNNRIYGLTKGQYSPTSELGKITKTSPRGAADHPIDPVSFALGCGATFIARTYDVSGEHLADILRRAAAHRGTAFIEILQNCPVFNDGAFEAITAREHLTERQLRVRHGEPLTFGTNASKGLRLDPQTLALSVVDLLAEPTRIAEVLRFDETNALHATLLARLSAEAFPLPLGVLHATRRPTYEELLEDQAKPNGRRAIESMDALFVSGQTWEIGGASNGG